MSTKPGTWLLLAALALAPAPAPGQGSARDDPAGPLVTLELQAEVPLPPGSVPGRVFDAYLDVRIALVRQNPILADQVARLEDLTPLRARLAPWLEAYGTDFDGFARSHNLVARDPGLRSRVEAILERHAPGPGATPGPEKAPPEGGAIIRPP